MVNKVHNLKCRSPDFDNIRKGLMSFQIRKNDREYTSNDILVLNRLTPEGDLTGEIQVCKVTHALYSDHGLKDGFVLLNIQKLSGHISEDRQRWMSNV